MANYPCQDCKNYMCKYTVDLGIYGGKETRMKRTCAEQGVYCIHQAIATPCKRSNCAYWKHENSVNGISWCDKCIPMQNNNGDCELSCKACMVPDTFDLWTREEIAFICDDNEEEEE